MKALVSGEASTKGQAMEIAGYSRNVSSAMVDKQPGTQNAMIEAMKRAGLTEDKIALKIQEGLEARQYHYFTCDGNVVSERTNPDASAQHKYLQTSLEVLKYIKNNTIENLNIGLIAMPSENETDKWENPIDTSTLPTENEKVK